MFIKTKENELFFLTYFFTTLSLRFVKQKSLQRSVIIQINVSKYHLYKNNRLSNV